MNHDTSSGPKPHETPAQAEQRVRLARRLAIAIATPMVMLVVLGVLLGRQIVEMADDSAWVEHTDQVLAAANETLRQIADQENGIASYLFTRDRELLEPFERARPLEGFIQLRGLVADNPPQQARFDQARERYQGWLAIMAPLVNAEPGNEKQTHARFRDGKANMDELRELLTSAIGVEEGLRRARVETSQASTERAQFAFVGLLAGAALLLAFLSRHQLRTI